MFKTILLDFDGTVFDTAEGITKSVQYALKKFGIDSDLRELYCFCGPPLVDMVPSGSTSLKPTGTTFGPSPQVPRYHSCFFSNAVTFSLSIKKSSLFRLAPCPMS